MDATTKTVIRSTDAIIRARQCDAAAREMARSCDKRIAEMKVALKAARQFVSKFASTEEHDKLAEQIDEALAL